jgi:hypothetical protein
MRSRSSGVNRSETPGALACSLGVRGLPTLLAINNLCITKIVVAFIVFLYYNNVNNKERYGKQFTDGN